MTCLIFFLYSKNNVPSFRACSHLLSSISGYQYSRKAWRKDALELFMDSSFFQMEPSCLSDWKIIIDHLMTHDKTSFRDFLSLMSVNKSGSLKIFSSKDQEIESRAQLTKRLAFILYCSEKDQYQKYMPEIQGIILLIKEKKHLHILHFFYLSNEKKKYKKKAFISCNKLISGKMFCTHINNFNAVFTLFSCFFIFLPFRKTYRCIKSEYSNSSSKYSSLLQSSYHQNVIPLSSFTMATHPL